MLTTALYDWHLKHGAKMVDFASTHLPIQYDGMGVLKEHLHVRTSAGIFDVSHMGQSFLTSENDPAIELEKIVPGDIQNLKTGRMRYTVLLNESGGIVDDLMVTRIDENTLYLVVNAACKEKDYAFIQETLENIELTPFKSQSLLALQGPKAEKVLAGLFPAVQDMTFMTMIKETYKGAEVFISRSGYTGEDGFEISLPDEQALPFADELMKSGIVKPIGLGARDSLRLEAGLCLYGHDLDETTTPVEANLKFVIAKRRRTEKNFAGALTIMAQFEKGPDRLRVGLKPEGRAPIREGTEIFSDAGDKIGHVTSGGFGPTVGHPVAMSYVETKFSENGTIVQAMVRGKPRPCTVVPFPFIEQRYKK